MLAELIDLNLLKAFLEQLRTADAVTVNGSPLLTSWESEIPENAEDVELDDSFVLFKWTDDEGLDYESYFSPRAFEDANRPEMPEIGRWKIVDTGGDPVEVCFFRLLPLRDALPIQTARLAA